MRGRCLGEVSALTGHLLCGRRKYTRQPCNGLTIQLLPLMFEVQCPASWRHAKGLVRVVVVITTVVVGGAP
jgi:hypothetical protein